MFSYFAAPAFAPVPFRQPALAPVLSAPPETPAQGCIWKWLEEANFLSRLAYGCGSSELVFGYVEAFEEAGGEIVPGEEEPFWDFLAEQPGGNFALQRLEFAL